MYYRSFADLNHCISANLTKVPPGADLIVGIPRSGLLAANLLALHLNLPLADLDSFVHGRILNSGRRLNTRKPFGEYKQVIVLDDSILTGKAMAKAKAAIKASGFKNKIVFGAVFAAPDAVQHTDFYCNICPIPRMFEWNLLHHDYLRYCCLDMDGVLCHDPTDSENDDGKNYEQFLNTARPFLKPTSRIAYIVTNRLEKYRLPTERWLSQNNISYDNLVMSPYSSREERIRNNRYAEFKADVYTNSDCALFIESSEWQACKIANISKRLVYCTDKRKMIYP